MTRDVILIHETLAEGQKTYPKYQHRMSHLSRFGYHLPTYHGPHRFECCDRAEHGVHSGGEGRGEEDSHHDENCRHNDALNSAAQHGVRNDGERLVDDHVRQEKSYK